MNKPSLFFVINSDTVGADALGSPPPPVGAIHESPAHLWFLRAQTASVLFWLSSRKKEPKNGVGEVSPLRRRLGALPQDPASL